MLRCKVIAAGVIALGLSSETVARPAICTQIEGALVIADGNYIGKLASKYDADSIYNKYGTYGSKYNSDSIWNRFGTYGSPYNQHSPFNKFSSEPPLVVADGQVIGNLTTNKRMSGAMDPLLVGIVCFDYEPQS